jgi:hypothetical protein
VEILRGRGLPAVNQNALRLEVRFVWLPEPDDDSGPLGVGVSFWVKDGGKRKALAAELDRHGEDVAFKDMRLAALGEK